MNRPANLNVLPSTEASKELQQELSSLYPNLDYFRSKFEIRAMSETATRYINDCIKIPEGQGLMPLSVPPLDGVAIANTVSGEDFDSDNGKYLWIIDGECGSHALESLGATFKVGGGKLKHSNLTGGTPAHGGGELWYWKSPDTVVLNAASGRYGDHGPKGVEMAQALVDALRKCGAKAATSGIEPETNFLRTYLDPEAELDFG